MVDVEPYEYQRKTNLKEHNDLVAKINEIVDVINNTNMDTIIPRIAKIETDITGINSTDALQWKDIESVKGNISTITPKITRLEQDVTDINSTDAVQNTDISNLKTKDSEHDTRLGTIDTEINNITKSLVSDVAILNGTTTGNIKVRIGREDAPSIDSDDYNIQKPISVELMQGSAPAMIKAQITLSDGTVLISDDFMFTTAPIGEDVYISSFVFKNGNVAGSISADIGLSNGSTLEANNFVVPTDPNVTTAISDIQGRVTTVENDVSGLKTTVNGHTTAINGLNNDVSGLKTTVNGHTTAINGLNSDVSGLKTTVNGHTTAINALDSDVADLQIDKADVSNNSQSIVAGSISATNISKGGVSVATINDIPIVPDISGKVDIAQGTENAGKVLGINSSGNVEPTKISGGGEAWEEVDLNNWPTNWVEGDRIKIATKYYLEGTTLKNNSGWSNVMEIYLSSPSYHYIPYKIGTSSSNMLISQCFHLGPVSNLNNKNTEAFYFAYFVNGSNTQVKTQTITEASSNAGNYKIWRLKK